MTRVARLDHVEILDGLAHLPAQALCQLVDVHGCPDMSHIRGGKTRSCQRFSLADRRPYFNALK